MVIGMNIFNIYNFLGNQKKRVMKKVFLFWVGSVSGFWRLLEANKSFNERLESGVCKRYDYISVCCSVWVRFFFFKKKFKFFQGDREM